MILNRNTIVPRSRKLSDAVFHLIIITCTPYSVLRIPHCLQVDCMYYSGCAPITAGRIRAYRKHVSTGDVKHNLSDYGYLINLIKIFCLGVAIFLHHQNSVTHPPLRTSAVIESAKTAYIPTAVEVQPGRSSVFLGTFSRHAMQQMPRSL